MKLTNRDAITTALAAVVVAVTVAVVQGWAWPLLGSPRAGIIAVGILGAAMCSIRTRSEDMATKDAFVHHPGMIVASALGAVALVLLIVGLIVATETMLLTIASVLVLLWAIATIRHAATPTAPSAGLLGSTDPERVILMVAVKGEIIIDRRPEEVFEFVANAENEPRYNSHMRVAKKITDGPIGVGTSFRQEIIGRRTIVPMTTEFTGFERPRRLTEVSTWTTGSSTGALTFEPTNGSTLLRWSWDVRSHGIMRFMGPVVAAVGSRQERRIWTGLKRLLESQPG